MAIREILRHPNDMLRRKAQPVKVFDDQLQKLIDDMIDTMRAAPGVGLAAPQVNMSLRVVVVEYGGENDEEDGKAPKKKKLYTLINPELSRFSTNTEVASEGCLSIPGLVGDIERAVSVTVIGRNRRDQPIKVKANGWLARILQHELDHLNGILYIDRADKIYQLREEDRETPRA